MKKFVIGALGILLLIALLLPGCSSGKSSTNPGSTALTSSAGGDKQIIITYSGVSAEDFSGTYYQNIPQAGNIYIIVDITIENHSNSAFNIDPLGFSMVANGVDYQRAFVFELKDAIQLGIVPVNGSLTGKLAFEVPEGTSDFTMKYQGDKNYNINWVKQ
jgi:hypothetical protein